MFAVHGIRIVSAQATLRTIMVELRWAKHNLDQPDKEGDPEDHDEDREEPTRRSRKRDVSEPGRRQRGDREVEGIGVIGDSRVRVRLRLKHHRRHDEDKDEQVHGPYNDVLVATESRKIFSEAGDQLVGTEQTKRSGYSQKRKVFAHDWSEQGNNDDHVRDSCGLQEFPPPRPTVEHSRGEIHQDHHAKEGVEDFGEPGAVEEGRHHQEQNDDEIKGQ